ncbi:hypothetical protein E8E14_000659 [Neopestalotiopsis sp. 37M]|nr:hypothetical protein E8E14_000659 [Neopestalotiopsis sp. 37M]
MASPKKPVLTARETELAGLVWQCFEIEPKVNFKKLAELAGFKNAATASACWGPAKKKLMANAGIITPTRTPTTKRSAATLAAAGTDDQQQSTPTKKPRKTNNGKSIGAKAMMAGNGNERGAILDGDVDYEDEDKGLDDALSAQLLDDSHASFSIKEEDDKNSFLGSEHDYDFQHGEV